MCSYLNSNLCTACSEIDATLESKNFAWPSRAKIKQQGNQAQFLFSNVALFWILCNSTNKKNSSTYSNFFSYKQTNKFAWMVSHRFLKFPAVLHEKLRSSVGWNFVYTFCRLFLDCLNPRCSTLISSHIQLDNLLISAVLSRWPFVWALHLKVGFFLEINGKIFGTVCYLVQILLKVSKRIRMKQKFKIFATFPFLSLYVLQFLDFRTAASSASFWQLPHAIQTGF